MNIVNGLLSMYSAGTKEIGLVGKLLRNMSELNTVCKGCLACT